MKKDKEWLKQATRGMCQSRVLQSLTINVGVLDNLIDQLDEPEITEEQALNKLAESYPFSAEGINAILQAHIAGYSLPRK